MWPPARFRLPSGVLTRVRHGEEGCPRLLAIVEIKYGIAGVR
jgi:hypothetical protein